MHFTLPLPLIKRSDVRNCDVRLAAAEISNVIAEKKFQTLIGAQVMHQSSTGFPHGDIAAAFA
jgi:hypothetical protein